MACDAGNNTLDPYQILLDAVEKSVATLEKQSRDILPFVTDFRSQGNDLENISDSSTIDAALADFTKEAICASKTDLAPINNFVEDCLNDILRGVNKYVRDMLGNIEDGIDLIQSILALPESALMKLIQKIWRLCDNIVSLVSGIDGKISCLSIADVGGDYTGQIEALNTRIGTVTDDLYLDADGSFNHEKLMTGFEQDLQNNLDAYKTRSDNLQSEIRSDVDSTISTVSTVNPKKYF